MILLCSLSSITWQPSLECVIELIAIDSKVSISSSSAVREAGLQYLNEGDELTFEVENGEKGPSAVNLQKA